MVCFFGLNILIWDFNHVFYFDESLIREANKYLLSIYIKFYRLIIYFTY